MLNKYSTSEQVVLRSSRQRQYFLLFLALAIALANYQVYAKGHTLLSVTLTLGSAALLWQAWPDPMAGALLKWHKGEWFIQHRGRRASALLLPGSVRLPRLIYVAFQETHAKQRWRFWLFSDSADASQLRQLRRRLMMQQ